VSSAARIETAESKSQLAELRPSGTMNVGYAANVLGISPGDVDRFCKAGTLRAQRSRSGYWMIDASSVVQLREANPNANADGRELDTAEEQRAVPMIELAPCPRGACEAHWSRRGKIIPAFRLDLCRRCFFGHPLPPKAEEEILDAALHRAPVASVQAKAIVPAKRGPVIQEAMEKEPGTLAIGMRETVGVSAAAQIVGCSPDSILRWISGGAIEARRVTSRGWWRIDRASLTRFLDRCGDGENSVQAAPGGFT